MRIILTLLIVFNTVFLFSENLDKRIILSETSSHIKLNKYTYIYSTLDTNSNVNEVINKRFYYSPSGLKGLNHDSIFWERFSFNNPTNTNKAYYIYYPYSVTNTIIAYREYKGVTKHITSLGMMYPRSNKVIETIGYPIKIILKPGITNIYIYIKHYSLALRTNPVLLTKKALIESNAKTDHIIWFWKGFFFFATLISLTLFFITRIRMFLYYLLSNIGMGIFFSGEIGEISRFIIDSPYNITANIKQTGVLFLFLFFPLLINEITPIAKLKPKLWKGMYLAFLIVVLSWFGCLFPFLIKSDFLYFTTLVYNYYAPVVILFLLYLIFIAYRKKQRNALNLFLGYSIYFSFTAVYIIMPNFGIIENDLEVYNIFIYGSIFEITMFMVLIGKETLSIYNHRAILLENQKEYQINLVKAIVESQERERNNAGRELHDMIGANISVIKQQVDSSNKTLIGVIDRTIDSIRNLSHGLITPLSKGNDFIDEINELCVLLSNIDLKINSHFHNWSEINEHEKLTHLYRIVQEMLQNAVKHSKAQEVTIQFLVTEKNLTVMYEDDGIGFDFEYATKEGGIGLINIENRIRIIGGTIEYDTKLGGDGTTIIIHLQLL